MLTLPPQPPRLYQHEDGRFGLSCHAGSDTFATPAWRPIAIAVLECPGQEANQAADEYRRLATPSNAPELETRTVPSPETVLQAPDVSHWLKDALRTALLRDPIDAANDARLLLDVLDTYALEQLTQSASALGLFRALK